MYWLRGALREYHWQLVLAGRTEVLRQLHRDQIAFLSRLAVLPAASAETLRVRAQIRLRVGRFPEALDDLNEAIDLSPAEAFQWYLRGCLLAYLGDTGAYAAHRAAMLSRFGNVVNPPDLAEHTAKSCVLLPPSAAELAQCERLIGSAMANGGPNSLPWIRLAKGMVEYRAGHYGACAKRCSESRDTMRDPYRTALAAAECFTAMAHHQLDNAGTAREAFERARLIMETQVAKAGTDDIGSGNLDEWLIAQVAYREAAALLAGRPAASGPATTRPAVPAEQ